MNDLYLGRRVASTGDESFLVRGQGEGHHVARVSPEGGHLLPRLNIPQNTKVKIHNRFKELLSVFFHNDLRIECMHFCLRSINPYYKVSYYMNWAKTSWTYITI